MKKKSSTKCKSKCSSNKKEENCNSNPKKNTDHVIGDHAKDIPAKRPSTSLNKTGDVSQNINLNKTETASQSTNVTTEDKPKKSHVPSEPPMPPVNKRKFKSSRNDMYLSQNKSNKHSTGSPNLVYDKFYSSNSIQSTNGIPQNQSYVLNSAPPNLSIQPSFPNGVINNATSHINQGPVLGSLSSNPVTNSNCFGNIYPNNDNIVPLAHLNNFAGHNANIVLAANNNTVNTGNFAPVVPAANTNDVDTKKNSLPSKIPNSVTSTNSTIRQTTSELDPSEFPDLNFKPPSKNQRLKVNRDQLDAVARDCIQRLSESKEHVSTERIQTYLLRHYGVGSLSQLSCHSLENIPSCFAHIRLLSKINAYIQAFVKVRSVCTVHELSVCLSDFADGEAKEFSGLQVGPIIKLPLVYEYFRMPADSEPPEISTFDVLEQFRNYLSQENLWQSHQLSLEAFLKYLVTQYEVQTPYHLGVRIRSLALLSQVIKKAQRDCGQTFRSTIQSFKNSVKADLSAAFHGYTSSLIDRNDQNCYLRDHYYNSKPHQVLTSVIEKYDYLANKIHILYNLHIGNGHLPADLQQISQSSTALRKICNMSKNFSLVAPVFNLAACGSIKCIDDVINDLTEHHFFKKCAQNGVSALPEETVSPDPDVVCTKIIQYLERCISQGALTLTSLMQVENKIISDFNIGSFNIVSSKTFLEFLLLNPPIKELLNECSFMTSTKSGPTLQSVSMDDILNFIKQCSMHNEEFVEAALCHQFGVKEVKHLGNGTYKTLLKHYSKRVNSQLIDSNVSYQCALLRSSFWDHPLIGQSHHTKEQAICCLQNCPLLADMAEWSQWELLFKPDLGPLKNFIDKFGHQYIIKLYDKDKMVNITTDFPALEVKPNILLKLTRSATLNGLYESALSANPHHTMGLLVSIIAMSHSVDSSPMALVADKITTAMFKLNADDVSVSQYQEKSCRVVANFTLQCLVALPLNLCLSIASEALLKPLGTVLGVTKSREVLRDHCESPEQRMRLLFLSSSLGISEWSDMLSLFTAVPQQQNLPEEKAPELTVLNAAHIGCEQDSPEQDEVEELVEITSDDSSDVSSNFDWFSSDDEDLNKEQNEIVENTESPNKTVSSKTESDDTESEVDQDSSSDHSLSEAEEVPEDPFRSLIEKIRREEFGVNVKLSADGEALMVKHQERMGRSLERLSRELYSCDTHFVLELVQNADDNNYHDDCETPSLQFHITNTAVTIKNNECGFIEKNVRAICDVGKSTKPKNQAGYIGQKGIGFKSVFRVSNRPEIHSSGFHLCFDTNSGPMGYILPHWCPPSESVVNDEKWNTQIVLPLKSHATYSDQTLSLAARFRDIHPNLLLFLHKLREISIFNEVEKYKLIMTRRDLKHNIVEITHDQTVERWLVVKKTLEADHMRNVKQSSDLQSTEIALAFPMPVKSKRPMSWKVNQHVFAYLPLRTYGFKFIIQGDFEVPSSREDVDKDSMWNQWIRNEIHLLFIEVIDVFKNHPSMTVIDSIVHFINFIPLDREITDFFHPVATNILALLRATPFLPASTSAPDAEIEWRMPSQLVITSDVLVREVISPTLLHKCLNLSYLHETVEANMPPALSQVLGVKSLNTSHLIEISRSVADSVSRILSTPNSNYEAALLLIAKILVCIFRTMDDFNIDDDLIKTLRSIPLTPLADGRLIKLESMSVFFPLTDGIKKKNKGTDPLLNIYKELNCLHSFMSAPLDDVSNSQLNKLFTFLGVKSITSSELIQYHILPDFINGSWKEKREDIVIDYVLFLKSEFDKNSLLNMNEVSDCIVLLTNKGFMKSKDTSIYLTPEFLSCYDFLKSLPGYPWTLISDRYLPNNATARDRETWAFFFKKLGLLENLVMQEETIELTHDEMLKSQWKNDVTNLVSQKVEQYIIKDWRCAPIEMLIKTCAKSTDPATCDIKQLTALYKILNDNWSSKFSKAVKARVLVGDNDTSTIIQSSFARLLVNTAWLPSIQIDTEELLICKISWKDILHHPSGLFIKSNQVSDLLFYHVPFLNEQLQAPSLFTDFLGIPHSVNAELLSAHLITWSRANKPFFTTPQHIISVYKYLHDNLSRVNLRRLFSNNALILIFAGKGKVSDVIQGKFSALSNVWWSDPSGLFIRFRKSLKVHEQRTLLKHFLDQSYPPEFKQFFVQDIGVSDQPQFHELVQLLLHVTSSHTVTDSDCHSRTLEIFSRLGDLLGELPEQEIESSRSLISGRQFLPTTAGDWVSPEQNPLLADDPLLEKIFSQKDKVFFVDLKIHKGQQKVSLNVDCVTKFVSWCGVKTLSESVTVDYTTEMYQPCPETQEYLFDIIPLIHQMLSREDPEHLEKLIDTDVPSLLNNLKAAQVSKLEIVYRLTHLPIDPAVVSEKCRIRISADPDEPSNFYVCRNFETKCQITDVVKELARFFSLGSQTILHKIRGFLVEFNSLKKDQHQINDLIYDRCDSQVSNCWAVPKPLYPPKPAPPPVIPEVEVQQSPVTEKSSEVSGIRSWPPVADSISNSSDVKTNKAKQAEQKSEFWPPPDPAVNPDLKALPKGFVVHLSDELQQRDAKRIKSEHNFAPPRIHQTTLLPGMQHTPLPPGAKIVKQQGDGVAQTGEHIVSRPGGSNTSVVHHNQTDESPEHKEPAPGVKPLTEEKVTDGNTESDQINDAETSKVQSMEVVTSVESSTPEQSASVRKNAIENTPNQRTNMTDVLLNNTSQHLIREHPRWTVSSLDEVYSDTVTLEDALTFAELTPLPVNDDKRTDGRSVGYWGEQLVYHYLQKLSLQPNSPIVSILWLNNDSETDKPYDLHLKLRSTAPPNDEESPSGAEKNADTDDLIDLYVEVKSTRGVERNYFEISSQQLRFAYSLGAHYHLYRVFNAGQPAATRVSRLENLAQKLDAKQVKLFMVI